MSIDPQQALPQLGGMSAAQFMRRYWQKKPCLLRQALPDIRPPVGRAALFELAGRDDVESRLVLQTGTPSQRAWKLRHGPFTRRQIPPLTAPNWTLLVQGLDLHVPAAHELLGAFRFLPDARLDDLMISYASQGGGVGPHQDSYDVFLIQVSGQRRWRLGPVADTTLVPQMPVKLLAHFEPAQEIITEPGDVLYLPPRWGHDGIGAGGDCMTCSVGFRTPTPADLAREVLQRMTDALDVPPDAPPQPYYRDPPGSATATPGLIPQTLREFAARAVVGALNDRRRLECALGEVLTEPKATVWFDGGAALAPGCGVRLDARTRMMYDETHIYINGESFRATGRDARLMRRLADARTLPAAATAQLSAPAREVLAEWAEDGWIGPWN